MESSNEAQKKELLCNSLIKSYGKWKCEKPFYFPTTCFFQYLWSYVFESLFLEEKNNPKNFEISDAMESIKEQMNKIIEQLKGKYRKEYYQTLYDKDQTKFNSYLLCVDREEIIMKHILDSCIKKRNSIFLFTSCKDSNLNNFLLFILKEYIKLQMEIINKRDRLLLNISDPEELIGRNLKWYRKRLTYNIGNYQGPESEVYFMRFLIDYYKKIQIKFLDKNYNGEREKVRQIGTKKNNNLDSNFLKNCLLINQFDDRELFDFINISFENQEFSFLKIFIKKSKKSGNQENQLSVSCDDIDNFYKYLENIFRPSNKKLLSKFKIYKEERNTVKFLDLNYEYHTDYWESKSQKTFISILKGFEIISLYEKIVADANADKKEVISKIMKYNKKYKVGVQEKLEKIDLEANNKNIGISITRDPLEDYILESLEAKLQEISKHIKNIILKSENIDCSKIVTYLNNDNSINDYPEDTELYEVINKINPIEISSINIHELTYSNNNYSTDLLNISHKKQNIIENTLIINKKYFRAVLLKSDGDDCENFINPDNLLDNFDQHLDLLRMILINWNNGTPLYDKVQNSKESFIGIISMINENYENTNKFFSDFNEKNLILNLEDLIKAYQNLFWLNRLIVGIKFPETDEIYRNKNNPKTKQEYDKSLYSYENNQNEKIAKFLEILTSFNREKSEKDLNTLKNSIKDHFISLKINTQELKKLKKILDEIRKIFDRTRDREFFNELCKEFIEQSRNQINELFKAIESHTQNYLDLLLGNKANELNEIEEFNKVCQKLEDFEKTFGSLVYEFKWDLGIKSKLSEVKRILEKNFEEYLEDEKMPKNLDNNNKQEKFDYISKKLINLKQHSNKFPFIQDKIKLKIGKFLKALKKINTDNLVFEKLSISLDTSSDGKEIIKDYI